MTQAQRYQKWVREFQDNVRDACKAFKVREFQDNVRDACKAFKAREDWPDAWLLIDGEEAQWYCEPTLFDRPVFRTPAKLEHRGHEGEAQVIIPLWQKEISDQDPKFARIRREFEARLAKSGDF